MRIARSIPLRSLVYSDAIVLCWDAGIEPPARPLLQPIVDQAIAEVTARPMGHPIDRGARELLLDDLVRELVIHRIKTRICV